MNDTQKTAIVSGKMTGTKTFKTVLEGIANPDEKEVFLKEFIQFHFESKSQDSVVYLTKDDELDDKMKNVLESQRISIHMDAYFSKVYIRTDSWETYVIDLKQVSRALIGKILASETLIKFSIHSYKFIQWCIQNKVEMKNFYDIPICVKILTNESDPIEAVNRYIAKYSEDDKDVKENEEKKCRLIGNFAYEFGTFLWENEKIFELDTVYKMIFENSFNEILTRDETENCCIKFGYNHLFSEIESTILEKETTFEKKAYVLSPLRKNCTQIWKSRKNAFKRTLLGRYFDYDYESVI